MYGASDRKNTLTALSKLCRAAADGKCFGAATSFK